MFSYQSWKEQWKSGWQRNKFSSCRNANSFNESKFYDRILYYANFQLNSVLISMSVLDFTFILSIVKIDNSFLFHFPQIGSNQNRLYFFNSNNIFSMIGYLLIVYIISLFLISLNGFRFGNIFILYDDSKSNCISKFH